ncbi:uncharacterized protein LOC144445760 [Glandiceps talaboti]
MCMDVEINRKTITSHSCSCKAGIAGSCAHILALVMSIQEWLLLGLRDIPEQISSTGRPQQWDKPRGSKITPEPASQMVICKPGKINRKRKPVMAEFVDTRTDAAKHNDLEILQGLKTPISYLCSGPSVMANTQYGPVPLGSALIYHAEFLSPIRGPVDSDTGCGDILFPKPSPIQTNSFDPHDWDELAMSQQEAVELEKQTVGQSNCQKWFEERARRLTASKFGRIMKRKAPVTDKFLQSLFQAKPFFSVPTNYGIANEKIAKQMFLKAHPEAHMHPIGLVVNPKFAFLAGTSDARVCMSQKTGIAETKCPFTARDMTIEEACRQQIDFCLELRDNKCTLKRKHEYWYQVQGQLMVTGAPYCLFIVYIPGKAFMWNILNPVRQPWMTCFRSYTTSMSDMHEGTLCLTDWMKPGVQHT